MALRQSLHSEIASLDEDIAVVDLQLNDLRKRRKDLETRKEAALARVKTSQRRDQDADWERTVFPWSKVVDMIRSKMGISSFRRLQLSTINATLGSKDCILIMPTGGGKSLCYQIPAAVGSGITVVISPLVSLMEDQFLALKKYGIDGAVFHNGLPKERCNELLKRMVDDNSGLRIVYVTPERIAKTKTFNIRMEDLYARGRLARIVIDEVHCCSQWGHDFRPDYKALNILKRQYPKTPLLGLTATATVRVLEDVQDMLGMQGCVLFRAPFNRKNLFYEVQPKPATHGASVDAIADLIKHRFENQCGIVYCLSIKDTEEVAGDLKQRGIKSAPYHASLTPDVRSKTHHAWINNKIHVVVATVAFGMGIDKPDVRFVIHHTLSKSIETFYQESGRAGRDGEKSACILFFRMQDFFRIGSLTYHEKVGLDNVREMAAYAHNIDRCRREPLANHFGEEYVAEMCGDMCDVCKKKGNRRLVTLDVTDLARNALLAVDKAKGRSKGDKCTAIQLMQAWLGTTRPKLGDLKIASQPDCERIIMDLLLSDYFRQSFHATAYTYVSYLGLGPRAGALLKGKDKIEMTFEVDERTYQKTLSGGKNVSPASGSKSQLESMDDEEDLVAAFDAYQEEDVINDSNLLASPPVETVPDDDEDVQFVGESSNGKSKNDSEVDLDFGDLDGQEKADKAAKIVITQEECQVVMKRSVSFGSGSARKKRGLF